MINTTWYDPALEFEPQEMEPFISGVGFEVGAISARNKRSLLMPRTIGWPSKRRPAIFDVVGDYVVYHPGYAMREGAD